MNVRVHTHTIDITTINKCSKKCVSFQSQNSFIRKLVCLLLFIIRNEGISKNIHLTVFTYLFTITQISNNVNWI